MGIGITSSPATGTTASGQGEAWPLAISQHSLALLVEVLLLRQQQERETKPVRTNADTSIMTIWARFLASLKNAVMNFDNRSEQFEGRFKICSFVFVVCYSFTHNLLENLFLRQR